MPHITPGSAFCRTYTPVADWSFAEMFKTGKTKRETAADTREGQLAKGVTGTIYGLSPKTDSEIARTARLRKPSQI